MFIIAGPRTGSTALGHYIFDNTANIKYFCEPDLTTEYLVEFLNFYESNNNFVLKVMPDHFVKRYPTRTIDRLLLNNTFKIKLKRKDKAAQVASLYIAEQRNLWHFDTFHLPEYEYLRDQPLDINLDKVKECVRRVLYADRLLDMYQVDLELNYEDLALIETNKSLTPNPNNYDEIVALCKLYLSKINKA